MFKLISVVTYENNKAVCLCYADQSTDLSDTLIRNGKELELTAGSLAYLANGKVYVFDGTEWNQMGGN